MLMAQPTRTRSTSQFKVILLRNSLVFFAVIQSWYKNAPQTCLPNLQCIYFSAFMGWSALELQLYLLIAIAIKNGLPPTYWSDEVF